MMPPTAVPTLPDGSVCLCHAVHLHISPYRTADQYLYINTYLVDRVGGLVRGSERTRGARGDACSGHIK